jgi:Ca2+-transporting ATPase
LFLLFLLLFFFSCTDKTGTLTQGKMTSTHVYSQGRLGSVSGKGFSEVGDITFGGNSIKQEAPEKVVGTFLTFLLGGCLCNNTSIVMNEETKKLEANGNMSEAPLVVAAAKLGMRQGPSVDQWFPRVDEVPFNSKRKLMATLHKNVNAKAAAGGSAASADSGSKGESSPYAATAAAIGAPYFSAVKGAPNYVLDACTSMLGPDGEIVPLNAAGRKQLLSVVDELSSQALRVLAMAFAPMDAEPYRKEDGKQPAESGASGSGRTLGESGDDVAVKMDFLTKGLCFAGFAASIDPPRDGIKNALETSHTAGIRTMMITGELSKQRKAHCTLRVRSSMQALVHPRSSVASFV